MEKRLLNLYLKHIKDTDKKSIQKGYIAPCMY